MLSYAVISCFAFPFIGNLLIGGDKGLEYGFLLGLPFVAFLWFFIGKKLLHFK
jgi:hypothetical protein